MRARQKCMDSPLFDDITKVYPMLMSQAAIRQCLITVLEFIHLAADHFRMLL
jgi:glutamate synthase (ferredoxin)